jgi:membrane protein implicated in regulation of membrane protease activity
MRMQLPDAAIAQAMLWIWVAIVVVALVLVALWRRWRRAHPLPKPEQKPTYSQSLSKRLAAARQDGKGRRQRGPADAGGPRER